MSMTRHKDHSVKRFFASRAFLVIALILAIFVAFGFARAYYRDYKVREEIQMLQDEVKRLETKKFESVELLKYVTSDTFVEEKARTELNLKKPGERVVFVNDLGLDSDEPTEAELSERSELNNITKWWYYFTHKPLPNNN